MSERTYSYRIYPTVTQEKCFEITADTCRALYNQLLKDRTEFYRKTHTWKRLNPDSFIKHSLIMRELDASIIKGVLFRLEQAYKIFFHIRNTKLDRYRPEAIQRKKTDPGYQLMDTDLIGYPRIKKKETKESWDVGGIAMKLTPGRVYIPNMGHVKICLHRQIPESAEILYYTVLKKPSGHYFLLVHLQMPEIPEKPQLEKAIGVTLVPGRLVQCSDGLPIRFRHQQPGQKAKMTRAYEKLSVMTPGSNRYEKQRRYLASLYEKRTNQRRDSLHKAANAIVQKADMIVMEEPAVQRKKKRLTKMGAFEIVQDEAWWTFYSYLKYETTNTGKWLWKAPSALPFRNCCSVCGVIAETKQKSDQWICPTCGVTIPAELNAARNLERFAEEYLKEWNEENQQVQ